MATLPIELVPEILRWSPAKSILRFRSVSKQWASFCSVPYLAKLRRQNPDCKLIERHGHLYSLDLDSLDCALEVDDLLHGSSFKLKKVLGCSNGMLCLSVFDCQTYRPLLSQDPYLPIRVKNFPPDDPNDEIIVICNLSTGARRVVPSSPLEGLEDVPTRKVEVTEGSTMLSKPGSKRIVDSSRRFHRLGRDDSPLPMMPADMWRQLNYGFGFDPSCEDYKLVRISHYRIRALTLPCNEVLLSEIKVYSMKTDSWSKVDQDMAHITIDDTAEPSLVDGVLYWPASKYNTGFLPYRCIVVAFDLASDSFLDIVYEDEGSQVGGLGSTDGKLCAMTCFSDNVYPCPGIVKFWKIEEHGDVWILMGFSRMRYPFHKSTTMHFSKNGDKVLVWQEGNDHVCVDLAKGTFSEFRMKYISMQGIVEKGY